jgi:tRNA1(Val) A37 N6-methylase TrmN6
MMSDALQWAHRLGMAMSQLFAPGSVSFGDHYAMLDGRRASFACSIVDTPDIRQEDSRNWQWSADLAHHVLITSSEVQVRSGRDPLVRKFQRNSVETQLEEFLNFLDNSRRSALPDVVPFLVQEFQGIWGTGNYADGQSALTAFLFALHAAGEVDVGVLEDPVWLRNVALEVGLDVTETGILRPGIIDCAHGMQARAPFGLRLVPSLVLRHVSGRLFQEAHAILESVQLGLFGGASITTKQTYSPAGAYFTPVPIARLLAEWALQRYRALPDELTIADFACGSAVFLTESLRVLERRGFRGVVHLVGRDKSGQAITMAKVAVRTVQRDIPTMRVISDIIQADAFDTAWRNADIVLMNPPFRSWERMNVHEREWVHEITHGIGRPDLSVGFIERAIRTLNPSGVLATLLPAGVLASDSLHKWRDELLQRVTPSLIAVLGEHGLFQHALVNVGILAVQKSVCLPTARQTPLCVAWSSAEAGAAAKALRAIRRSIIAPDEPVPLRTVTDWSIDITGLDAWRQRPSWLPGAGALGSLLESIQTTIDTKVADLFRVRQGIRTGANEVFIQARSVLISLPESEQRYFREAVDAASFVDGAIEPRTYLFVPDPTWQTESEVNQAIPQFFGAYLQPREESLKARKRKSSDNSRWWELTWPRFWAFDGRPRLLSKRFGLYPAFARDLEGCLAVVQANAWIPTDELARGRGDDTLRDLLTAYWWMLNSRVVVALLREYCPNVAGGQLDLEHKYVKHVPLPSLPQRFQEDPALQLLSGSIRTRSGDRLPTISERDHFAAAAFGTDLSDWNLSGLELPA